MTIIYTFLSFCDNHVFEMNMPQFPHTINGVAQIKYPRDHSFCIYQILFLVKILCTYLFIVYLFLKPISKMRTRPMWHYQCVPHMPGTQYMLN